MSFGPSPWQQTNWDWRAAGNFICGGAGAGLIVFTTLSGAAEPALGSLLLAGLALVATGLLCVWAELGRPLRALHVFFNLRSSWMTREAIAATLLFPAGIAAALGVPGCRWAAATLALAFIYCQGRMLQSAKGIPAWREPLLAPLFVATGLAEGGGLFFLTLPLHEAGTLSLLVLFGAIVLTRALVWLAYRRRLAPVAAPRALAALDRAGRLLQLAGTLVPLVLVFVIAAGAIAGTQVLWVAAIAGLAATAAGAYTKLAIVTRAGFNQGFALVNFPVRGARS
ncbi:MAG TPA: phenylacetyl-CoA:acceptor oxidoreductase [Casimicrobiaceae bacterium]